MERELQSLEHEARQQLAAISDSDLLEEFRIRYLGRKGQFSTLLRRLGTVAAEDRPRLGQLANTVTAEIERLFEERQQALRASAATAGDAADRPDLTLPGRIAETGRLHPVTQIMQEVCAIFENLGFSVAEGPDVELDYYNFEALNIPKNHPARDMQDTFFVSADVVLRTHTSPLQVRTMERQPPPVRVIAPGKVFRCDSDQTHTPMFHQVEGLLVDENISFADLKGTLTAFVHQMFDEQTRLRFRPSFFPFTEPSAEVDILCVICRGKGCRVCKQTGWLEILGSGMVHPAVFENVGYDTQRYTGFAFGMGVERVAMLKYGIDDLRKFFENDLRFLTQF